jgi:hypothetical protein
MLKDSLTIYETKNTLLPLPDDYVTITSSNNNYWRCNWVDMSTPKKNKYTNVYVK